MTNHLFDGLMGQADPARRFARIPGEDGAAERHYAYAHLDTVSARFANRLVALGLKPGDRVAVQAPKSLEALVLYLGVVRAGGVFLPLNTAYTPSEVEYFLRDATPRVFVCDPGDADGYAPLCAELGAACETMGVWRDPQTFAGTLLADAEGHPETFDTVARGPNDLAAILYTSGTTGRSKGAMLSHENLLSNARTLAECWRFTRDDVLIHALPIFHTHGLFVATNVTLVAGAQLVWLPAFSTDVVLREMRHATTLMGVPTFYTRLLDDARFTREAAAGMRLFVSGSAPLLAETHRAFEARTGSRILERYGMTETNMNTSNPYEGERRAGTVGLPLPGIEVKVCDDGGNELPRGQTGIIEVRGPNVFQGYWQMPQRTAEELRPDGFFITGDNAVQSEDGYVTIVGRAKDLIISGGYNIYPKEIELLLDEHPAVKESAVVGAPHPDFGESVVAVLVPAGGAACDGDAVLASLEGRLARFKRPRAVFVVDELPRNTMGKVQKNALRERYARVFAK